MGNSFIPLPNFPFIFVLSKKILTTGGRMKKWILMAVAASFLGCAEKQPVDLIVYNAKVYTVDSLFSQAEAIAVKDGRFVAVGSNDDIRGAYSSATEVDASGRFIYPGFIDAHCHFYNYGLSLMRADLRGTGSFEEVLERLVSHYQQYKPTALLGRGWDQNDWKVKDFPDNHKLDSLFPDIPVMITRIDGHAVLVNSFLLNKAGITASTKVAGGEVILKDGKPGGVLLDNAIALVDSLIPMPEKKEQQEAIMNAEGKCFAAGLTTVADAGLDMGVILLMDEMQTSGQLKMRVYAMINPGKENYERFMYKGVYKTERMDVRSIKIYADGALGSRGACLLEPYSDAPGNRGLMVADEAQLRDICLRALNYGYQVNVHAIGDSAVRTMLKIYADVLARPNDLRWRIEHAQVVSPEDLKRFASFNIIPSVQPTHATSDMYWAADRLGAKRVKTAYAYRSLLEQNGWLAIGTDFPIENIEPLLSFYAAVFRIDAKGFPDKGWQAEQALSREQALRGMTIWAARSCFEEDVKGSIEAGKFADFVMLDSDLMNASAKEILNAHVIATYLGGEKVFSYKNEE
jgi:predicted amidohydrolase YtcJ